MVFAALPEMATRILLGVALICGAFQYVYSQNDEIDSLRRVRDSQAADTNKVNTSLTLAEALWRVNKNDESILEAGSALRLAKDLQYDLGISLAFMHQGIAHYRMSNFNQANSMFALAAPHVEKTSSQKNIALIYHWSGNALYRLSQYHESLEFYLKALKIREDIQDEEGVAYSLYNIANIYYEQGDYDKSLEYHLKSLKIKEELGDKRGLAFSYNNIANIHSELRQDDVALNYYWQAHQIFVELDNQQGIAYALGNVGRIYVRKKLYTKAFESLTQAKEIFEKLDDKNALIEAHNNLAEVLLLQRQFGRVLSHLQRSEALSIQTGVEDQLIQNYLLHARLDSAMGNFVSAFEWHKKYTKKKESLFNTEKSKQITEMQAAFDLERKDQQIASLNNEKELQESLRINQQITFAIIIVALIVASMGLLYILKQRQKANQILEEQKRYAEELNQLNDKLFSIISHDLRGPLWSLRGVLEMASKQMITEKELTPLLSSIGDNTQHVIDLLENLLNWSKGHLQGEKINATNFDLSNVVTEVIELHKPISSKKEINILAEVNPVTVYADKNMIELVIRNLISNAIKFTPGAGSIQLTSTKDQNYAHLSVKDTGVGIRPDSIAKLFGNQTYTTRGTNNEKGTGLGLTLCREFIAKNGGTISVQSAEGAGSTFTISIPLAPEAILNDNVQSNGSTLTQSTSA